MNIRNTDNCSLFHSRSFLSQVREVVNHIKSNSNTFVVLGGTGYSLFPESLLKGLNADFGIWGDGEVPLYLLLKELRGKKNFKKVPNLYWKEHNGKIKKSTKSKVLLPLERTGRILHKHIDYYRYCGQANIETSRGCDNQCIYCADPVIKGKRIRKKPLDEIMEEFDLLLSRYLVHIYICDSEFNVDVEHCFDICNELIRLGFARKIKWYAYIEPKNLEFELIRIFKFSGCEGININLSSGSPIMLERYNQFLSLRKLERACNLLNKYNIPFLLDILIGGPGETMKTIKETTRFLKKIKPFSAAFSVGLRIYPGTSLSLYVRDKLKNRDFKGLYGKIKNNRDFLEPIFYLSENLNLEEVCNFLEREFSGEPNYFIPGSEKNHNYTDNENLKKILGMGKKGAYWKILLENSN